MRIVLLGAPPDYAELLAPLPEGVRFARRIAKGVDAVHMFVTERAPLSVLLPSLMKSIKPDGMIWISWPKKASGVATDLTEDVIRAVALPLGLVDMKVCAVDATWSGLKLVIRKELRKG
jgi:hypothetical protein